MVLVAKSSLLKVVVNDSSKFWIFGAILCCPFTEIKVFIKRIKNTFFNLKSFWIKGFTTLLFLTWDGNLFVGNAGRQTEPIPIPLNFGIVEKIACVWWIRQNKTSIAIKNFIFEIFFYCLKTEIDTVRVNFLNLYSRFIKYESGLEKLYLI